MGRGRCAERDGAVINPELQALREENQHLRELARTHEIDREAKDFYERLLTEIGKSIGCGHLDERLPACVSEAVSKKSELAELLNALTADEGDSVRLVNPNPDFGGPNATIFVAQEFEERETQYFGETVIECLRKAVDARKIENNQRFAKGRKP